ncbi:Enoyl-CoA hydratase/carnithine racemase [Pseudonocardia ammonioxydans]|uniref:Enoyl-CoA hydratase/carnithine racemase n=1 Tax=Pseudonocardia ammonioxydans TaxID=260086 RepID=A0A1I5HII7_PSUAM|nr:enoyl-CoA hydratase-related protein [Pseudonocardia ammonioxydans]SFO48148.1 Enoyl-CoA hydratase/carnithine racemase [Pseudonocardia ammonioxydans]
MAGIRRETAGGVATLTLDRPPRNALTTALADELVDALGRCRRDKTVRAIVLTGAADAFSAGADLAAGPTAIRDLIDHDHLGRTPDGYREPAGRVTAALAALPVPVVAAINGDAVGGGATIPLAADVRFAADDARFAFPFTRLGVCPEGGSTYLLPWLVGPGVAADWLLSGRLVDAREALAAGLVSRLLPRGEVLDAAQSWAAGVAQRTSPAAVAVTRSLLAGATSPEQARTAESTAIADLARGADCAEGVGAFLEQRLPRFAVRSTSAAAEEKISAR